MNSAESPIYSVRRIVSYYARPARYSSGGVNTSRQHWMASFADLGIPVLMLNAEGGYTKELVQHPSIEFRSIPHFGNGRQTMIARHLASNLEQGDLVYLHEGWTTSNLLAAAVCAKKKIPFIVMPHGVYAPEIVRTLKFWRARVPIEGLMLNRAVAVHTFFDSEQSEVQEIGKLSKALPATTGFSIPSVSWQPTDPPYLAWVGRYDVLHKGIDRLFQALASIPVGSRPHLKMVGPDYNGGKRDVVRMVRDLDLADHVDVLSAVPPAGVLDHLQRARGFVHVPRWEAFGRTIVEAMSMGVPTLLGDGAHIAEELGEVVRVVPSADIDAIASGLRDLWGGQVAGDVGPRWVLENLSWPAVIERATSHLRSLGMELQTGAS